jgi:uncharacterized protein (TIGR02118 family)
MHRLLVLHSTPTDPSHFKKYYRETHMPLAAQLPGLLGVRFSFAIGGMGEPAPFFCVYEADFPDQAAMERALHSEIGKKVVADVPNFATGPARVIHYEIEEFPVSSAK